MTMHQRGDREQHEQDRRRFFRIDDTVGLRLSPIPPAAEARALTDFTERSSDVGLLNELHAIRDQALPQRRKLEYKFPTVAAYIKVVERQIEMLTIAFESRQHGGELEPREVNLSAQGMCLALDPPPAPGSLLEIELQLLPEGNRILTLGRVLERDEGPSAIEFEQLRDADREAIVRHIHALQLRRLRQENGLD
ncbi:PilZ domain-containing protein [Marichromatium gracile]|uniref:PilZ domain-containing protein n=1 Tax=Marichromatium gracile TaxID=1048 RepID=UPI001F3ED79D|nr:PilZ domain-containing protein [Marichromatium gracile]MCF1183188.1 PilZ domain-containing protein [Marichromatium gracile]